MYSTFVYFFRVWRWWTKGHCDHDSIISTNIRLIAIIIIVFCAGGTMKKEKGNEMNNIIVKRIQPLPSTSYSIKKQWKSASDQYVVCVHVCGRLLTSRKIRVWSSDSEQRNWNNACVNSSFETEGRKKKSLYFLTKKKFLLSLHWCLYSMHSYFYFIVMYFNYIVECRHIRRRCSCRRRCWESVDKNKLDSSEYDLCVSV